MIIIPCNELFKPVNPIYVQLSLYYRLQVMNIGKHQPGTHPLCFYNTGFAI